MTTKPHPTIDWFESPVLQVHQTPWPLADQLTVIVPAYNEAEHIADTIRSLQKQTTLPAEILVVDDCSSDGTSDVARACGVRVLRPPKNTGSKAGAQNFALDYVATEFTMTIDADTVLAPNAIEKLLPALQEPGVAAACGFVVPRYVRSLWEQGRYIEDLFAFTFYKQVQDYYEKPLISSGCFSAYRTEVLRRDGGWPTRTMAEDMDLTWGFYQKGHKVRFVPDSICEPIEPHNFTFMKKQLRRWSHGFVQNVRLHWKGMLGVPYLRWAVGVALWDAVIASIAFLLLIPVLAVILGTPLLLLAYVIDIPAVLVPVVLAGVSRKEMRRVLASLPAFYVLRLVNSYFFLEAIWTEFMLRRPLTKYEKGH
jgi:cellulose synthase/poly-beta-1,6-N-acetylglucosamine synthase-like glycosyltransferase